MYVNVIGLEVSTSATKCIIYSSHEGIVESISMPYDKKVSDTVSQDPEGIFNCAMEALKKVVQSTDRKISAIGLGGTWHSLLLLDEGKNPLGRIRTWADSSAASSIESLKENEPLKKWFYNKTGCMVHALYPAWKIYHLQKTDPETIKKTHHISSQMEYVYQRLTGDSAVSMCTASGTGLFNIHDLDWDDEILNYVGVDRSEMGNLKEASHAMPLLDEISEAVGLPKGIPVTVGSADGAMNQVAIGGGRKGIMSFSIGTSAAIRMLYDEPVLPENPSTWCYYLANGQRIAGAATQACNNLDWFADGLIKTPGEKPDYKLYDEAASKIDIFDIEDAPYFLPFVFGERCPGWNENRRGGFHNIDYPHDRVHLYYSVLEGILFNVYQCYKILTQITGAPKEIRISGGIMNSPFWLQLAANIFNKQLFATGFANDSTVGAALFALQAAEGISDISQYQPDAKSCCEPKEDMAEILQKRFGRYLEIYQSNVRL